MRIFSHRGENATAFCEDFETHNTEDMNFIIQTLFYNTTCDSKIKQHTFKYKLECTVESFDGIEYPLLVIKQHFHDFFHESLITLRFSDGEVVKNTTAHQNLLDKLGEDRSCSLEDYRFSPLKRVYNLHELCGKGNIGKRISGLFNIGVNYLRQDYSPGLFNHSVDEIY